jgi:hypothetical protein
MEIGFYFPAFHVSGFILSRLALHALETGLCVFFKRSLPFAVRVFFPFR